MNFWDSFLVACKMLLLLLDGGLCAVFVLLALAATALLFSILPRQESRPGGRLLAALVIFWSTRNALLMQYIPGIGSCLWLLVPAAAALSCWRHIKNNAGREEEAFDHTLGAWIWVWGGLWMADHGISLFAQGTGTAWVSAPLGVLGGWIVGRALARLWFGAGQSASRSLDMEATR